MLHPRVLLVPSSPTLLIEERRGSTTPLLDALAAEAARLDADRPDAIVVVSSRWSGSDAFLVDDARRHTSLVDRPSFGVEPRYDCEGEPALARAAVDEAHRADLHAAAARRGADSGVSVPLHFLAATRFARIVPVSLATQPAAAHHAWGAALRRAMIAWSGRAMLLVSGSLTFHEHSFNLRREIREDRDLDVLALDAMQGGDWSPIEHRAGRTPGKSHPEAGWLHLAVLHGFLGEDARGRLAAYEALPGMGEALVEFDLHGDGVAPGPAADSPATMAAPARSTAADPTRRRTGTWRAPDATGDGAPRPATPRGPRPGGRPAGRTGARPGARSSGRAGGRPTSRPSTSRPSSSRPAGPRPSGPRPPRRRGAP